MKKIIFFISLINFCFFSSAQTINMPINGSNSISTCISSIYDDGGYSGIYSNSNSSVLTIYPGIIGSNVKIDLVTNQIATGDTLYFYDGNSTNAPLVGKVSNNFYSGVWDFISSSMDGSITIKFLSDAQYNYGRFHLSVTCTNYQNQPDLYSELYTSNLTNLHENQSFTFQYKINNGGEKESLPFATKIYISSDSILSNNDILIKTDIFNSIYNTQNSIVNSNITIPDNLGNNQYYLLFHTDANNDNIELNEDNNINAILLNIRQNLKEDLFIKSENPSNSLNYCTGSNFTINHSVKNLGEMLSDSLSISYFISYDPFLDSNDILINNYPISPINFEATANITQQLNLPNNLIDGFYYLISIIDPNNNINEINEKNNIDLYPINIQNCYKDINLYNFYTNSDNFDITNQYTLTYSLNNSGSQGTNSSIDVYLSIDTIADNNDILLKNSTIFIDGNLITNSQLNFTIPNNVLSGEYNLIVLMDKNNLINELDETNNQLFHKVKINEKEIDLKFYQPKLYENFGFPGRSLSLETFIQNNSNFTVNNCNIKYYISLDDVLDSNDISIGNSYNFNITPSSNFNFYHSCALPTNIQLGQYYFIAKLDPNNLFQESNEANNYIIQKLFILEAIEDFEVNCGVNPVESISQANINVNFSVYNGGKVNTTPANYNFVLSQDNILDNNDITIGFTYSLSSIASGATSNNSQSFYLPNITVSGLYYIFVVVDKSNIINESNEQNNTCSFPIYIKAKYVDLEINSNYNPNFISQGNTLNLTCNIKNNGTITAASNKIGFYISTDTVLSMSDNFLSFINVNSLLAGNNTSLSTNVQISNSIPNGSYYILYVADYTFQVSELNENNNIKFKPINISNPFFDLTGGITSIQNFSLSNDSIKIGYYIKNQGILTVNNFNISFFISQDSIIDQNDSLLKSKIINSINPNTNLSYLEYLKIPFIQNSGNYYVILQIDKLNQINESNENNNLIIEQIKLYNSSLVEYIVPRYGLNTITVNEGLLFDNGGNDSLYATNSGGILTILPTSLNSKVELDFLMFNVESNYDFLYVYDGMNTGAPLLGTYTGNNIPPRLISTNVNGALTLVFSSDEAVNSLGFKAIITTNQNYFLSDLDIESNILSEQNITSGENLIITSKVRNLGQNIVNNFYVGYYLSTDTTWQVSDNILYSKNYSNLNSNGYLTIHDTINIPQIVGSGSYYIIEYIDNNNQNEEVTENNNFRYTPLNITHFFNDLIINSSAIENDTVNMNDLVMVKNVFKNDGVSSLQNVYGATYLSIDSIKSNDDIYVLNNFFNNIGPGIEYERYKSFYLPNNIISGDYYLINMIDLQNYVSETNEFNNITYLKIHIKNALNDYSCSKPKINYCNQGNNNLNFNAVTKYFSSSNITPPQFSYSYYFSIDNILDSTDSLVYTGLSNNFGQNYNLNGNFSLPNSIQNGNYFIICQIDNNNQLVEYDEANNTSFTEIIIREPIFDLTTISQNLTNPYVNKGIAFNFVSCVVNNSSFFKTNFTIKEKIILSQDTLYDSSDVLLYYNNVNHPSYYSTICSNYSIVIPDSIVNGQYYLLKIIDSENDILESDEYNNVDYTKIFVISPSCDLLTTSLSLSTSIVSNLEPFTLDFTLLNHGTNNTNSYSNIKCFLSLDSVINGNDIELSSIQILSIPKNYIYKNSLQLIIPENINYSNYYLLLVSDVNHWVNESNENNNLSFIKIDVNFGVSNNILQTASLNLDSLYSSLTLKCYSQSYNSGTLKSKNTYVKFYLSNDSNLDGADILLSQYSINNFTPKSTYCNYINLSIPNNTLPGNYNILVKLDDILKSSNNNLIALPFTYLLSESDLVFIDKNCQQDSILGGEQINTEILVKNIGFYSTNNTNVGYYLSSDNLWSSNDILLKSNTISSLVQFDSIMLIDSMYIPTTILNGQYYLIFYLDNNNILNEAFESNNWEYKSLYVKNNLSTPKISKQTLNIFPNPSKSNIFIESSFDINRVEIIDLSGKQVYVNNQFYQLHLNEINISNLNNGSYLIKIYDNENIYIEKLIIENK